MREEEVLRKASFDSKLKVYWLIHVTWMLFVSMVGIPFIPIWLLGLGQWLCRRRYECMEAELTARSLNLRMGYLIRVEKNVPLDKIQDLALREGPILRKLGLSSLGIETAGSSGQGAPDASLVGVIDAVEFRDAVLDQREAVVSGGAPDAAPATTAASGGGESLALLGEIRDTLLRIEQKLGDGDR
jgi:putative membrane protein